MERGLFAEEISARPGLLQSLDPRVKVVSVLAMLVGVSLSRSLAVIAGAFCQSRAIVSACEGISRNPAGAPAIRGLLILGLVLIETLVIYALLITIIILMVQWGKYV